MPEHGGRLALNGVEKRYAEVTALARTDLAIGAGEFFSLIGPSGSGKSTLLGAVAGFVAPSAGSIEIDGQDVVQVPPYRRNVGMVFQNYALFPHMSVFENIAFPLRLRKLPEAEVVRRVERILAMVRLPGFADRRTSQLSGGQQQRVALARAAVYDPRILLMDEPLGALDKNLREEMQVEIKDFHRQIGATIVYVTHDQEEAAAMSNRIAIMNHGRIVQVGPPRELYENPCNAFAASFLGDANLFEISSMRAAAQGIAIDLTGGGSIAAHVTPGSKPKSGLVACVRPEAIALRAGCAAATGAENRLCGTVVDVVHAAGSIRYRVDARAGRPIHVRAPSGRQAETFSIGQAVTLAWSPQDTLLIPKE